MPKPSIASNSALTQRQRGAVMIMTAGFMLLGVLCLALVVDTGRLYLEKRSLQRIADVVALEVESLRGCELDADDLGTANAKAMAKANAALARLKTEGNAAAGAQPVSISAVTCGGVSGNPRVFDSGLTGAVEVVVARSVTTSLVAGGVFRGETQLTARAVAVHSGNPLARLTIRSNVATVDTSQSLLLNAVLGNLLGSNVALSAISWQGLVGSNINLLDLIGVNGLNIANYESVLSADVALSSLMLASANVLSTDGNTAAAEVLTALSTQVGALTVNLGELLGLKTGLPESAADINLNILDMVPAAIQLATKDSAVNASVPINIPALGSLTVSAKVIEPPQLSRIGDPRDINKGLGFVALGLVDAYAPLEDDGDIFVRTAQIRLLLSVKLDAAVEEINNLLSEAGFLGDIASFLNGKFSLLNIVSLVGDIVGDTLGGVLDLLGIGGRCGYSPYSSCDYSNILFAEIGSLDIGIDIGGAQAFVTDHSCATPNTLSVHANTEVGKIYVGKMSAANKANFFKNDPVTVTSAPIISLGIKTARPKSCTRALGLFKPLVCSGVEYAQTWESNGKPDTWGDDVKSKDLANIGINTKSGGSSILAKSSDILFSSPPNIKSSPDYISVNLTGIVGALGKTIKALEVNVSSASGGPFGVVFNLAGALISTLLNNVITPLLSTLSTVLDPIIDGLLKLLGAGLADADIGANMSCLAGDTVELAN